MKKLILILCFGLGNALIANANDCQINILTDNFSSSANWQSQGNGDVNISNGKCNFDNVYCGSYNRVYRNLSTTLSDNYWKAECDFTILNTNPSGNGTSEILMALTAGNLNFMTYDSSQGYAETTQDGIAVVFQSAGITDNNINNWYFCIQSKKGNIRTTSTPTQIYANSTIINYYIRLERTSNNTAQLSVFSDPAFTIPLPGSPVTFVIDAAITGLNTVQHGTNCGASSIRLINAEVDNDLICQNSNSNNCEIIILNDNFLSSANWLSQGNGDVNISNGKCNFDNVYCGSYNRVYRNLGATLSDNYWKAECDFTILNTNPSGYGTSEILMALTAGNLNFMTYDASQNYDETTQDGIAVIIQSASITDSNINNWYFCIQSKKGNIRTTSTPTQIYANSTINNYYIKLERISNNATQLGVFSDPAFTTHLSGSPVAFVIDATITGLNTVQHGTNCGAASARLINAAVDNDLICHNSNSGITEDLNKNTDLLIYPNPTIKNITIESPQQAGIEISDMQGQLIKKLEANGNKTIVDVSGFPSGLYVVKLKTEKGVAFKKFVRE